MNSPVGTRAIPGSGGLALGDLAKVDASGARMESSLVGLETNFRACGDLVGGGRRARLETANVATHVGAGQVLDRAVVVGVLADVFVLAGDGAVDDERSEAVW